MIAAALYVLAATASHVEAVGPLAKAEQGFLQCYAPNDTAKTCASLAAYKKNEDGSWANTAIVLLAPDRPITLETVTPVSIRGGAVCGFVRKEDVLKGKLKVAGQAIPDDKAVIALARIAEGMAPMMDKEICTEYLPVQDGLVAKAKIAGSAIVVPEQKVKWVRPDEGYSVAPAK